MRFSKKKSLTQYIVYYISEIAIVIVGIFIAIQLNNLNENSKNKKAEKKSLQRIINNLKTEKYVMSQYKKRFTKDEKKLKDILYNGRTDNLDSILYYFQPFNHFKMNTEYISLKYSGKLSLIRNDTLRNILVKYYELYYKKYDLLSKKHTKMIDDGVLKYLNKGIPTDTTGLIAPTIIKLKLKDIKFRNHIIDQINALREINKQLKIEIIDKIINRIENKSL